MQITLLNQTSNILSYANGQINITGNGQSIVSPGLIPYLPLDPNFRSDIGKGTVIVSDGVTNYQGRDALDYLNVWLQHGIPQTSNDPISFTLAGLGFSIAADTALTNTNETPTLYIVNPNNSGVNARLMYSYGAIDSTQGILTTRIYINPTISNNGTPITPQNSLISQSAPSSAMNVYAGPTVSTKGALRISLVNAALTAPVLQNFNQTSILTPGNSLLITMQAANLGVLASLSCHAYLHWVEI